MYVVLIQVFLTLNILVIGGSSSALFKHYSITPLLPNSKTTYCRATWTKYQAPVGAWGMHVCSFELEGNFKVISRSVASNSVSLNMSKLSWGQFRNAYQNWTIIRKQKRTSYSYQKDKTLAIGGGGWGWGVDYMDTRLQTCQSLYGTFVRISSPKFYLVERSFFGLLLFLVDTIHKAEVFSAHTSCKLFYLRIKYSRQNYPLSAFTIQFQPLFKQVSEMKEVRKYVTMATNVWRVQLNRNMHFFQE